MFIFYIQNFKRYYLRVLSIMYLVFEIHLILFSFLCVVATYHFQFIDRKKLFFFAPFLFILGYKPTSELHTNSLQRINIRNYILFKKYYISTGYSTFFYYNKQSVNIAHKKYTNFLIKYRFRIKITSAFLGNR